MKKRWLGILLALCLLVCLAPAALATETDPSVGLAEVYVSVTGDDTTGDGSEKNPMPLWPRRWIRHRTERQSMSCRI